MKKLNFLIITILTILFSFQQTYAEPINEDEQNYRRLDDLKKELKEERKVIDQQRLEQIKLKELEKNKNKNKTEDETIPDAEPKKNKTIKENQNEIIPSLIVRLRGKHSTKYLCEYSFTEKTDNTENSISKIIIEDYDVLLKKASLKVRPGETINFEFSKKPKKLTAYIYGDEGNEISLKKGCIKVPSIDKKIILIIEGKYDNGYIKYAVVLDIRN